MRIIVGKALHISIAAGVTDESSRNANRTAGVQDVDHRTVIGLVDAQCGVDFGRRRATYEQRHCHARALHLLGNRDHFVERGRDEP